VFFLRLNGGVNSIAGETIKGLNVVIGSDTTALTSALADVNRASRGIQTELRQVERLLRLDPSNVELVAQQQQLLTDAVANTSEKLNRLRAAQEQVNEQFARGEISAGQYRAFQREIATTEQQLSRFESQLSGTANELNNLGDAADNNADKLKDIGDKVKGAGEKMSMAITAPIVAAGGLMLKGAIDAENAQNKLQASLGITADAAADLEAVAQAVWVNGFGENIEEANASITTVRKNMGEFAEDEMQKVTEGALTIADIFEQDVNDVTVAAGVAMKNFGLEGQDALDLITVGFQKGGDYSGELLDSFREYAPQFASMGISADQAMGILIAGAEAGAWNLDKVGDAMKEFNIRAQDGSKATAEGFATIGLDAEKMGESIAKGGEDGQKAFVATVSALAAMKNPMEQNIAGTALFGTQWEDVRSKVIVAMADGMKGIKDFKGTTEEAAAAMYANNPGLALTKAMRELQLSIGPALLPLADIIKNTIVPAVKSMAEGFNNLSPAGQRAVLVIAGIAAAIGPLLLVIGALVGSAGNIVSSFSKASGAISEAGGIIKLATSPIGIAIIAIAALAAAAYLIYTNWEPIKEFFGNLWTSIVTTTTAAWEGIKLFFSELPGTISGALTQAIDYVTGWGKNLAAWVATTIPQVITDITTFFSELPAKLGYELGHAIGTLVVWSVKAVNWATTEVPKIIAKITEFFIKLPGKIAEVFVDVMTKISEWGTKAITWVTTEVPKFIAKIVNFYLELPGKIANVFARVVTELVTWASAMLTSVTTEVPKITASITEFFAVLPGKMLTIGKDIVRGLWEGIKSMAGWLGNLVKGFVKGLVQGTKDALGEKSPSKVFAEIGKNISLGMAVGITSKAGTVQKAIDELYSGVEDLSGLTIGVNANGAVTDGPLGVNNMVGAPVIQIINQGTLVGSNGMNEFADIMSRKIAKSFGSGTGGDF